MFVLRMKEGLFCVCTEDEGRKGVFCVCAEDEGRCVLCLCSG